MASISSLKISGVDYDIIAKSAMAAPAVELSAGTDLKIVDNVISVNTNGTIGNSADMSFVAGSGTYAAGIRAAAFGCGTSAVGNQSHAEGYNTSAVGNNSHTEGGNTKAVGGASHAEGGSTWAVGDGSHAEGGGAYASGDFSHAEGDHTSAVGSASHAEGSGTSAIADFSHAEGGGTKAGFYDEELFGNTYGLYSHAEGETTEAKAIACHAEGKNTHAGLANDRIGTVGNYAHAEGYGTITYGYASHAEGVNTLAGKTYIDPDAPSDTLCATSGNHAEGSGTSAVGEWAHAEGIKSLASGDGSHAEGNYTSAFGIYSHAGGSYTIASGNYSHTEGHYTKSYSDNAYVANFNNIAVGEATYANNVIDKSRITNNLTSWSAAANTMPTSFSSQSYFHLYNPSVNTAEFAPYYGAMTVFGMNNTAMGRATMAIGYGNAAITPYSFVAGKGNYTTEYGQTVVGCWRRSGSYISSARFIVGGGGSNTSRKNLLEVGDSNIYTPCDVTIAGTALIRNNARIDGVLNMNGNYISNVTEGHYWRNPANEQDLTDFLLNKGRKVFLSNTAAKDYVIYISAFDAVMMKKEPHPVWDFYYCLNSANKNPLPQTRIIIRHPYTSVGYKYYRNLYNSGSMTGTLTFNLYSGNKALHLTMMPYSSSTADVGIFVYENGP